MRKRFCAIATIFSGLMIALPAIQLASGQAVAPSVATGATGNAGAPGPAVQMEGSGLEQQRNQARESWQRLELTIKPQIDKACNPDRIRTLVTSLQGARTPYDKADRNYWQYQKRLTDETLKSIQEGDPTDVYPIDDLKKDLADSQKDLNDKKAQKVTESATLEQLTAQQKTAGKDDNNLGDRIGAQKQLLQTLDDVIKTLESEVERRNNMVEAAVNIVATNETLQRKWKLIGELADSHVRAVDDEANSAKQKARIYGQNRLALCVGGSQPGPDQH